ncbi:Iron only hydrogenase large subunit, C-terminal domain [Desulfotomaculum arcticum]|uniref:Iron only hydrogenase large subunit, C-terminal domain n=1 Tax=Desulfotruncus arcticus DSM 17038 TaxID=1121424 RepID=A0A1I2US24_9FIRM|nr:[Fe-Fe] hydrogenase large subunit C-terminal domain-containing protein [Desulfotruncus arcticus]SFG77736.1 Iron only hydrogenase large subunit, C-terminal domain [Desulfotomaculum arcticum] [Desulfotruncus arcticus DSM 17038]
MDLIITNEARCRDCYRCLRACPVKAIRIRTGDDADTLHAQVITELCVQDARCVLVCPQKAKKVVSELEQVKLHLQHGVPMAVGVAPSFVAGLPLPEPGQMPALLRRMGFRHVQETSLGAELVAAQHHRLGLDKPLISSACPVVVNLIEKHYPELIPLLAPVVSPMIAHGRYMKQLYPDHLTVFIGPCAAKKEEAQTPGIRDAIDFALGFDEFWEWVREEGLYPDGLKPEVFDGPQPDLARLFPIEGGMARTIAGNIKTEAQFTAITGLQNCIEFLSYLSRNKTVLPGLMELLACRGGCIDGPLMLGRNEDIFVRRQKVINYYRATAVQGNKDNGATEADLPAELMVRNFINRKVILPLPDEQAIRQILARTGKYHPEDELNCGACGYDSCRDKAVAVYQGNAEVQMCIPYMRRRAESMSALVMNAMPNAIILVNHDLVIKEVNPAGEHMFTGTAAEIVGQKLNKFIEPDSFLQVLQTGKMINNVTVYSQMDMVIRQVIFPLKNEKIIVGILVDITAEKKHREQFELVKAQTIARAQEVITKQMQVAQEIAGLLGETTAETKVLLTKLIELMRQEPL